jgi:hypothetical protein
MSPGCKRTASVTAPASFAASTEAGVSTMMAGRSASITDTFSGMAIGCAPPAVSVAMSISVGLGFLVWGMGIA